MTPLLLVFLRAFAPSRSPSSSTIEGEREGAKARSKTRRVGAMLVLVFAGCHPHDTADHVALLPAMDKSAEIQTLITRATAVHTVTGVGTIQLIKPDGESVVLDSIMVMKPPADVRLRATKLGHTVFDLTASAGGVYLLADKSSKAQTAGATAAQVTRAMSLLTGDFFADPKLVSRDDGDNLILSLPQADSATLVCRVDRATLTAREFKIVDASGARQFSLMLADYSTVGDAVWPRKATAVSDGGMVIVSIDDDGLSVNEPLADGALTPPPGAEKLP